MTIAENLDRLVAAKNNIATSITGKGVTVAETDGFEEYPALIDSIQAGGEKDTLLELASTKWIKLNDTSNTRGGCISAVLDGVVYFFSGESYDWSYWNSYMKKWVSMGSLPLRNYSSHVVVYDNELHFFGGEYKNHYKWNGSSWVSVSTLPDPFFCGSSVVLNGEIHVLGGQTTSHYKWNGSSWVSVSTIPIQLEQGAAVVLNNEIHIIGSFNSRRSHYKWNGLLWENVSELPVDTFNNFAVVSNNSIYMGTGESLYVYYNEGWTKISSIPFTFESGSALSSDNAIVVFAGYAYDSSDIRKYCYAYLI